MSSDPRLMALPALRKRAEEMARELHDAMVSAIRAEHRGFYAQDLKDALPAKWVGVGAHLALLADLSRPASRWELAALISERLGWDAVETLYSIERGFPNLIALYRAAKVPTPPGYDPNPTPEEATAALALAVLGGAS